MPNSLRLPISSFALLSKSNSLRTLAEECFTHLPPLAPKRTATDAIHEAHDRAPFYAFHSLRRALLSCMTITLCSLFSKLRRFGNKGPKRAHSEPFFVSLFLCLFSSYRYRCKDSSHDGVGRRRLRSNISTPSLSSSKIISISRSQSGNFLWLY